ncbi:MAG: peptidase MA family metallohydrolase [Dehalococcoidales bacterium]|nr:peptidase MA family metallohydrolase [Dehalococcoidales bacterium]
MKNRIALLALVVCLLLVLISPVSAQTGTGLAVTGSSVKVNFPATIDFALSVKSNTEVADIRLHYTVERMGFARVVSEAYVEFQPAKTVEARWTWDMRRTGGLPPGSNLEYWWTVKDSGGGQLATDRAKLKLDDNRFTWRSKTQGKVTIYWYQGDDVFANRLMTATQEALARLAADTGAALEQPVRIFVYGNYDDLRGSMIFPQEWTGGVAFTEYGILAIGIAPNNISWGTGAIAHELSHLTIHQMTYNPYGGMPTWLDEGLAMNTEGELEPDFTVLLIDAIAKNKLLTVRSIASPFSAYSDESRLAYAQSYSIVRFLTDTYGKDKMFELLKTFRHGSGYDEAFVKVYGFDMDELNSLWRAYLTKKAAWMPVVPEVPRAAGTFTALPACA